MAGKKRQRGRNATASAKSTVKGTAGSSSFTLAGSPRTKTSKVRKPTEEWIEINSDEEDTKAAAHARGVLRGLNPNNVLAPPTTCATLEIQDSDDGDDDEDDVRSTQQPAHSTRASRYGKAAVSYDMKYHPMDEVTRPKRAANRRSASRSESAPVKPNLDGETSDESSQSAAHEDNTDEDDPSESDNDALTTHVMTTRVPDPRASRHSGRTEARKAVNYSRKYHPQDYGLPGYQHKAKESHDSILPPMSKTASKRKSMTHCDASEDSEEEEDEPQPIKSPLRPRKKLKSLTSSSPATSKALAKPVKPRKKQGRKAAPSYIDTDDLNDLVDELCRGSQAPRSAVESDRYSVADGTRDTSPPAFTKASGGADGVYDYSSPAMAIESCSPAQEPSEAAMCEDRHLQQAGVQRDMVRLPETAVKNGVLEAVDIRSPKSPHMHNAQHPLTPTSGSRLVVVRPYFTGYEPTVFDLRSLKPIIVTRQTPLIDIPMPLVTTIDHSFSSSSDPVDTSHSEETRQTVWASSKVQATGTPAGSPLKQFQSTTDVNPSSSTLVGASGPVSTGSMCAMAAAAASHGDQVMAEEPRSDFEEQFSITDLPLYERGARCDKQPSDTAYEDLPLSQRERSNEQQPSSSASRKVPPSTGTADGLGSRSMRSSPGVQDAQQSPSNGSQPASQQHDSTMPYASGDCIDAGHPGSGCESGSSRIGVDDGFDRLDAGLKAISQALGTSQSV